MRAGTEARPMAARPVIPGIVFRHVEDAAYYWTTLDAPGEAMHLTAQRVRHFAHLLDANLEGLQVNGPLALDEALEALQRWRKPGEAFVAMYCALFHGSQDATDGVDQVMAEVRRHPDVLTRGAVSALLWAPAAPSQHWLKEAFQSSDPVDLVVALRASRWMDAVPGDAARWLDHENPHVRAAACRAVGPAQPDRMMAASADADLQVRAEAVIAWAAGTVASDRSPVAVLSQCGRLWECIVAQAALLQKATGWHRVPAARRLSRWLRELALLMPVGHPQALQLMASLPLRPALQFCLHHGDPALLPFVMASTQDQSQGRFAGWVWQHLTGVDLVQAGLTLEDPAVDIDAALTETQQDADAGLPLPNHALIAAHPANHVTWPSERRLMAGQVAGPHLWRALLDPANDQSQALRFVAAEGLRATHPDYAVNLRGSPAAQTVQLRRMGLPAAF